MLEFMGSLDVGRISQGPMTCPLTICLQCPFDLKHRDVVSMLGVGKLQPHLNIFWG